MASSLRSGSGVKDQFRDLAPLHSGAVGAVRGALELEGHFPTLHLCHALLAKVAELVAIQHHAGGVEGVWLDLHGVVEPHREGAAGAI